MSATKSTFRRKTLFKTAVGVIISCEKWYLGHSVQDLQCILNLGFQNFSLKIIIYYAMKNENIRIRKRSIV